MPQEIREKGVGLLVQVFIRVNSEIMYHKALRNGQDFSGVNQIRIRDVILSYKCGNGSIEPEGNAAQGIAA